MRIVKFGLGLVALIAIVVAIVAPIGPLPGFFIGGNNTTPPAPWMDTSTTHEITLRVPGALPRVVIIWVVQHDQSLYVVGSADSGWVTRLGEGGPVQMRLGEALYSLTAARVKEDLQPILAAYTAKYQPDYPDIVADFPSIEEGAELFAVFRLDRS